MKRRVKKYTATVKAKVILATLKENKTIAEIGSEYNIHPCNVKNWKCQFLDNIEVVFDREVQVKIYKDALREEHHKTDDLYRQIGKLTTQLSWAKKNLRSLDLFTKRKFVRQCKKMTSLFFSQFHVSLPFSLSYFLLSSFYFYRTSMKNSIDISIIKIWR